MDYSKDLLVQARILLDPKPGRPRQASLRRAVSNAYYALFHALTWEASSFLISGVNTKLRMRVQRSFVHAEMKRICLQFQASVLAEPLKTLLPQGASTRLILVAAAFADLQERRHTADYDMSAHFSRSDSAQDIDDADAAVATLRSLRNTEELAVFLAALAFGTRWSK